MVDASVSVEKEDHHENLLMDQAKKEMNKDDSNPSFSLGLEFYQPDNQSPVPQSTSVSDPNTAGEKHNANEDNYDGAPLIFPLRNTS